MGEFYGYYSQISEFNINRTFDGTVTGYDSCLKSKQINVAFFFCLNVEVRDIGLMLNYLHANYTISKCYIQVEH